MSEQRSRIQDRERLRENHQVDEGRNNAPKPLGGRICSVLSILFGVGGILAALMGIIVDIAAGVIGAALGVLGFFLGSRRLSEVVAVVLGVAAVFFAAAAGAGLIPGVEAPGHDYRA